MCVRLCGTAEIDAALKLPGLGNGSGTSTAYLNMPSGSKPGSGGPERMLASISTFITSFAGRSLLDARTRAVGTSRGLIGQS